MNGGYCIKQNDSEKLINELWVMHKEIRKEVDDFSEKELPKLWKEFENLIESGISRESAFNIIRSKI